MIYLTSEQFAKFQKVYASGILTPQRMGQALVNIFTDESNVSVAPEDNSPYSELFYVENSRFWEIVFNYVQLVENPATAKAA